MKIYKTANGLVIGEGEGTELIPNTTDAAGEKHVPVIEVAGNTVTVTVGAVEHPMMEKH